MQQQNKYTQQVKKVKESINLLQQNISKCVSYAELQTELKLFNKVYMQFANLRNNRANKEAKGFTEYLKQVGNKKRSKEAIIDKAFKKKVKPKTTYKDYIKEYIELRKRGYSFNKIALYSAQHYKVPVSKDTIRKAIQGNTNVTR